jgi:hypothetical protein
VGDTIASRGRTVAARSVGRLGALQIGLVQKNEWQPVTLVTPDGAAVLAGYRAVDTGSSSVFPVAAKAGRP